LLCTSLYSWVPVDNDNESRKGARNDVMVRASLESYHSVVTSHQSSPPPPRHHLTHLATLGQIIHVNLYVPLPFPAMPATPFNSTCLRHRPIISDIFPIKVREEHFEKLLSASSCGRFFVLLLVTFLLLFLGLVCYTLSFTHLGGGWLSFFQPFIMFLSLSLFFFKK